MMAGVRSTLYTAARVLGTVEAIASGDPRRIGRRAANIAIGRTFARGSVWRRLWGGGGR